MKIVHFETFSPVLSGTRGWNRVEQETKTKSGRFPIFGLKGGTREGPDPEVEQHDRGLVPLKNAEKVGKTPRTV